MTQTKNTFTWIFQVQAEAHPMPSSAVVIENQERVVKGAFVNIYVPANSLEESIPKAKQALFENHYGFIDFDWIRKIEIEEWDEDEGEPNRTDLEKILSSGECAFGLFYAYGEE